MTDQPATAKDWAAVTFAPVLDDGESKFDMDDEMEKAHRRAIVKCFGLKILEKNDVELTEMISDAEDPSIMLDLYDSLGELLNYYKVGLECTEKVRARLMVAMSRFAEQEGIDTDGGASDDIPKNTPNRESEEDGHE